MVERVFLKLGIPLQPVFAFLLWHHLCIGKPHATPPALHFAQSDRVESNQQGWSATGTVFPFFFVVSVNFSNGFVLIESAGHFGFEGLDGFFGFGFFLVSMSSTRNSVTRRTSQRIFMIAGPYERRVAQCSSAPC